MVRKKRSGFEPGDKVMVNELAGVFEGVNYDGKIGFITEIMDYPDECEPPFIVDFGNRETEAFYHYELDKLKEERDKKRGRQ